MGTQWRDHGRLVYCERCDRHPGASSEPKTLHGCAGAATQRHDGGDYSFSENIGGSKHFGVWPLSQAAEACFGTTVWPADRPIPHACFEFEVADKESVAAAAEELKSKGYVLLHGSTNRALGTDRCQKADGRRRNHWNFVCAMDA